MPVIGVPVSTAIPRRDEIRRFMRDYPGPVTNTGVLNVLLEGVEFSDEDVDAALVHAMDWYNAMTPVTRFGMDALPRILLMYGACAHLLTSEGMRQLRNQATVQDGNVQPIGIDDKQAYYQQWAQWMRGQFLEMARAVKTEWNMYQAQGGFSSGYLYTSRRNH
jgi:hypothetical protein